MKRQLGWLGALAVVVLLVAACGPQMATPTPKATAVKPTAVKPTAVPGASPQATTPVVLPTAPPPTVEPVNPADLPVDPNDYHALGLADAPVTFIEYSDFQ